MGSFEQILCMEVQLMEWSQCLFHYYSVTEQNNIFLSPLHSASTMSLNSGQELVLSNFMLFYVPKIFLVLNIFCQCEK